MTKRPGGGQRAGSECAGLQGRQKGPRGLKHRITHRGGNSSFDSGILKDRPQALSAARPARGQHLGWDSDKHIQSHCGAAAAGWGGSERVKYVLHPPNDGEGKCAQQLQVLKGRQSL